MLLISILTPALVALSLGSDAVSAAKHGRFAERARAPLEKAKRAVEASQKKSSHSTEDFRFLNDKTKRE